tara:strand:+ start:12365 stop:14830 length:2466 start_codon:yes stop_codon:yes gene_type:complete
MKLKLTYILLIFSVLPITNSLADNKIEKLNRSVSNQLMIADSEKTGIIKNKNKKTLSKKNAKQNNQVATQVATVFKEMVVTQRVEADSHYTSPSTRITRAQIETQNAQTTEEVLKFQPSLQIRQRYVGDPNGVLGIRGADMFSTARNMVYADGLPIHNHLQGTWNGAPRWSLVGPNEIDVVDVIYGPFSAEYSSNSIGGVVNLKTRMPRKREMYVESSLFIQPYKKYGHKGTYIGNRQYISAGDRFFDKFSIFAAYNRLESEGHPQTYFLADSGTPASGATIATGAEKETSARGVDSWIYGDSGPEKITTDLMKFKLGYDINSSLKAIFTAAYENRVRSARNPKNYLRDATGAKIWSGNVQTPGGQGFKIKESWGRSNYGITEDKRQTLQLGINLNGALTDDITHALIGKNWFIDTTTSHFNVLKDTRAKSNKNPYDPSSSHTGLIDDYKRFAWFNHDIKLSNQKLFGYDQLGLIGGYHFSDYKMKYRQYSLTDFANMTRGAVKNKNNRGQTTTHAFYFQGAFRFAPGWDITAGIRQEFWSATNGVVKSTVVPDRHMSPTTPKFSIGYEPNRWKFRYSWARTHRFPVISELFQTLSSGTSITLANAALKAENGMHHNFMIQYDIPKGFVRVNVFRDDIKDAINRVQTLSGQITTRATQNIGTTSTTGLEFIFNQKRIFRSKFDFMLNFTWMDAKVENGPMVKDSTFGTYNLTGKKIIRLPHYRLNFFSTYHITQAWDFNIGGRFSSDSFNDLDNGDKGKQHVFGAQSDFFFLDLKTNYRFKFSNGMKTRLSAGITNVNNMQAYVYHPYPQRTFLVEAAFSF